MYFNFHQAKTNDSSSNVPQANINSTSLMYSSFNHNKELKDINNRLDEFFKTVKDISKSQQRPLSSNPSSTPFTYFNQLHSLPASSSRPASSPSDVDDNSLTGYLRNLENAVESLKKIYENELDSMRDELKNASIAFKKLSTENYKIESERKDMQVKLNQMKKVNEDLVNELNDVKAKKKVLEYEFENNKMELNELVSKVNEKQSLLDELTNHKSAIEADVREFIQANYLTIELQRQEIEKLKLELTITKQTIFQLETKLNETEAFINEERNRNETFAKNVDQEEEAPYMNKMETNLEAAMSHLEKIKKDMENKNNQEIAAEIISIKSKLMEQENRLNEATGRNSAISSPILTNRPGLNTQPVVNDRAKIMLDYLTPAYQNSRLPSKFEAEIRSLSNGNEFIRSQDQTSNKGSNQAKAQTKENLPPAGNGTNRLFSSPNSTTKNTSSQPSSASTTKTINSTSSNNTAPRPADNDYTKDLFNNFERTTLLTKRDCNSSLSTIDNVTITEASYVGNVKIHEVNKNGYYVRLLNISSSIDEDLSNYTVQQMVSTMPVAVFRLPAGTKLAPGHTMTIWARTDEVVQQPPHTFIWYEQDRWGTGPECTTVLAKPNGQAVSWTTGSHKYGAIDYDEYIPIYPQKRSKSAIKLNREKLTPSTIYTPTKHPHGSFNSRLSSADSSASVRVTQDVKVRDLFANQRQRPVNSPILPSAPSSRLSHISKEI